MLLIDIPSKSFRFTLLSASTARTDFDTYSLIQRIIKAAKIRDPIKNQLYLVNMEIGKLNYHNPLYVQRVQEYNQAVIEYFKGKWYATVASHSGSKGDWKKSSQSFGNAKRLSKEMEICFRKGIEKSIKYTPSRLEDKGTEIIYADDVPLVPEITPVIILQGSDYEMGFQYAKQLIDIFQNKVVLFCFYSR